MTTLPHTRRQNRKLQRNEDAALQRALSRDAVTYLDVGQRNALSYSRTGLWKSSYALSSPCARTIAPS